MNPMIPPRRTLGFALAAALLVGCAAPITPTPPASGSASPPPSSAPSTAPPAGSAAPPPSAPASGGAARPFDPAGLLVSLEPVVEGLDSPLAAVSANDGSGRLFVVEKGGSIRIVRDGALLPDPFLDIAGLVSRGGEQGLLGLAFHPDYPDDPRFFVDYTNADGDTQVSSFTVDASNPDRADPDSEERLLFVDQPYANHNGGALAFGPDGFLYIALGDGGSGGDPHGNGQKLSTMLGKILRIDIDQPAGGKAYGIPPDNPFAGAEGAEPEIFLSGLRNPWRLSFDRETGDLWIGDVGQNTWEEIDVARAGTSGENYGWNRMEANHCFRPAQGCDKAGLTMPVAEYPHDAGCTVIGGYVYRGSGQPALVGGYLFGDYCSGTIWAIDPATDDIREPTVVGSLRGSISSFGENESGELYVTDISGGRLWRVVATRR
jgi:glucose/arabinose dehydrogenase